MLVKHSKNKQQIETITIQKNILETNTYPNCIVTFNKSFFLTKFTRYSKTEYKLNFDP